jgi:hypothetical protein
MELIQTVVGVLEATALTAPKEAVMQIKPTLSLFQVLSLQMYTSKIMTATQICQHHRIKVLINKVAS